MLELTKNEFQRRLIRENEKYFDGQVRLSKKEISTLSKEKHVKFKDFTSNLPSYLSPQSVESGNSTVDLSNVAKIDHKRLTSEISMANVTVPLSIKNHPKAAIGIGASHIVRNTFNNFTHYFLVQ